jgi:hypothetical protein
MYIRDATGNPVPVKTIQGATGPQGPQGPTGDNGATFTPSVSEDGVLSWTNNGNLENPPDFDFAAISESFNETDPTVPAWAKQPNKPSYTAAEVGALSADTVIPDGGIPIPNTASVGQTVVVKAVDENGRPTEWEAVDLQSGSSEWEIIASGELTEEATGIDITTDNNGNAFALSEAKLYLHVNGTVTNTTDRGDLRFRHNSNTAKYGAEVSVGTMIRSAVGVISGAYATYDYTSNVTQTNTYAGTQSSLKTSFCMDKGYEALTAIYILGVTENANTMGIGTKWALRGVRK